MSSFGTPQFGQPQSAGTHDTPTQQANGATQHDAALNTPQDIIDPNDPRLTSEAIEVNQSGDAYAQPAPPPDAKYRAKLKLEGVKDSSGNLHNYLAKSTKKPPVTPYLATAISAQIIDPTGKYDGIQVFDGWVGTMLGRDNSSKVSTILHKLKRPDGQPWVGQGQKMSHRDWMEVFVKALAGEPEVGIETQWEWSCQLCGEEAKKSGGSYPKSIEGMQKFPPENDATKRKAGILYQAEMPCQANKAHGYSRARVKIARFVDLKDVPGVR